MVQLDDELVARARGGDGDARKALVERASLKVARTILGESAKDRYEALRELERGDGPAPGLGVLLAGIARDTDGEVKRAIELVYRAGERRWGPPEREAVGRFAAANGARLGAELALELLAWAAKFPQPVTDYVHAAATALADVGGELVDSLAWRHGFAELCGQIANDAAARDLVMRWTAVPAYGRVVAKALLSRHAQRKGSAVPALELLWEHSPARGTWAQSLGEAVRGNYGMTDRDEIATWSWKRFVSQEAERVDLYTAFRSWRDLWIEQRNKLPRSARPGGESAVAHLALWGGLDVEQLSATIDEAVRLARDTDWVGLVDTAFDLGTNTPVETRPYGLAGTCRIAHEVRNRVYDEVPTPGVDAGADRLLVRAGALCHHLRDEGLTIDQSVSNRVEDLEDAMRLIQEARARRVESTERDRERTEETKRREQEAVQRRAEAEATIARAHREAEEQRARMEAMMRSRSISATAMPAIERTPIDDEMFFSHLAAPSILAYARLFKRLTSGDPHAMQSLAAEGVTMEMWAVITQTWSTLFAQRTELAIRFSTLIAAAWS